MTDTPQFLLRFTNQWGEVHYFVSLGKPWPYRPECRLISQTTASKAEAALFGTYPEAMEVLLKAGDPQGYEAVAV